MILELVRNNRILTTMMLFEFFRVYGDVVDHGKSPLQRLKDRDNDFSAEAALVYILMANIVLFGVPLLTLWFVARMLNFI